jgi:hypothetical protein
VPSSIESFYAIGISDTGKSGKLRNIQYFLTVRRATTEIQGFGSSAPAWDVRAAWPSSMVVQSSPVGIVTDSFTKANVRQVTVVR